MHILAILSFINVSVLWLDVFCVTGQRHFGGLSVRREMDVHWERRQNHQNLGLARAAVAVAIRVRRGGHERGTAPQPNGVDFRRFGGVGAGVGPSSQRVRSGGYLERVWVE